MIKGILLFIATMMFLLLIIIFIFTYMGIFLVVDHELIEADAIVLLNSNLEIKGAEAADVFLYGYADVIIIAQTYEYDTELSIKALIERDIPEKNIIVLPSQIRSTRDEAIALRDYLAQRPDINSLIIVTSKAHTRRSLTIFSRTLKSLNRDIVIISRASRYDSFQSERWWEDPQSTKWIILEYQKILYYYYLVLFNGNEEPLNKVLQFFNRMIQIK